MPTYHKISDPNYFDAITPPALRYSGAATREVMPGWDLGSIPMGDIANPETPVASMLKIAPGDTLPQHAHDCVRVEVMVQGSITLPDGTVLVPGDVMISQPGEFYGPHVAGPDGSLSVEIFGRAGGMSPISNEADEHAAAVSARVREVVARLQTETAGHTG